MARRHPRASDSEFFGSEWQLNSQDLLELERWVRVLPVAQGSGSGKFIQVERKQELQGGEAAEGFQVALLVIQIERCAAALEVLLGVDDQLVRRPIWMLRCAGDQNQ